MDFKRFVYIKRLLDERNVRFVTTDKNKIEIFNQTRHKHVVIYKDGRLILDSDFSYLMSDYNYDEFITAVRKINSINIYGGNTCRIYDFEDIEIYINLLCHFMFVDCFRSGQKTAFIKNLKVKEKLTEEETEDIFRQLNNYNINLSKQQNDGKILIDGKWFMSKYGYLYRNNGNWKNGYNDFNTVQRFANNKGYLKDTEIDNFVNYIVENYSYEKGKTKMTNLGDKNEKFNEEFTENYNTNGVDNTNDVDGSIGNDFRNLINRIGNDINDNVDVVKIVQIVAVAVLAFILGKFVEDEESKKKYEDKIKKYAKHPQVKKALIKIKNKVDKK